MGGADAIWEREEEWVRARYSPAYAAYLRASLPPDGDRAKAALARDDLARSPIVATILEQQNADGSWPPGPPSFRLYPIPLLVLLEYDLRDQAAVERGLACLFGTFREGAFRWPADPPDGYYVAYNARSLQVAARAELASDPRVRESAATLRARQRPDGGWDTKAAWMYGPGEKRKEPEPSCWICTMETMRALGKLGLPETSRDRVLEFWRNHLDEANVGLVLACLEFCADCGLTADDARVARFRRALRAAVGEHERFASRREYFEALASHLEWRLRAASR